MGRALAVRALWPTVLVAGWLAGSAQAQPYSVNWWTVDGGGAMNLAGGSYTLSGTIGQPDAGSLSGGLYAVSGGFWGVTLPTMVQADLAVTIGGAPDPVGGLGNITYTVAVTNAGPSEARSVSVTQSFTASPLPPPSFVSASGTGWGCAAGSGSVTCTRASLASGGPAPNLTLVWTTGPAGGTLTAQALVSATEPDPSTGDNTASTTTAVNGVPYTDLAISQTDGGVTALWNGPITYTLTVSNAGPGAVTGATVTDNFPLSVTAVVWTCAASAGSSCAASGSGSISDSSLNLLVGGTATYTARGTILWGTAGPITNTATVASPIFDTALTNNTSAINTPVNRDLIFRGGFQ